MSQGTSLEIDWTMLPRRKDSCRNDIRRLSKFWAFRSENNENQLKLFNLLNNCARRQFAAAGAAIDISLDSQR